MPSTIADILAANGRFYEAFADGDADVMDDLWARDHDVACIHPGWPLLEDRGEIMASWQAIFEGGGPPMVCDGEKVHIFGEVAVVICRERLDMVQLLATNVFVREGDAWRMMHHHAAPLAAEASRKDSGNGSNLLN